jgi:hypothetical protein
MTTAAEALASLTPAGREFMRLVGTGHFDFFDDGIVEHSGNWGEGLAQQAAPAMGKAWRSMGGIMAGTKKAGLWTTHEDEHDGTWWSLTALGAEVALLAAGKTPDQTRMNGAWVIEPSKPQPTEKRTRNELVKAIRAAGHVGPVTGKDCPTVAEVAALAQKLGV